MGHSAPESQETGTKPAALSQRGVSDGGPIAAANPSTNVQVIRHRTGSR